MAATLKLCTAFNNERYNVIYCAKFAGVQEGRVDSRRISGRMTHRKRTWYNESDERYQHTRA